MNNYQESTNNSKNLEMNKKKAKAIIIKNSFILVTMLLISFIFIKEYSLILLVLFLIIYAFVNYDKFRLILSLTFSIVGILGILWSIIEYISIKRDYLYLFNNDNKFLEIYIVSGISIIILIIGLYLLLTRKNK